MIKSTPALQFSVCGAVLGTVCLGLPASAMAWNEPLWVRQLGTADADIATGVATDAEDNVYLTGWTSLSDAEPRANNDAWVAKFDAAGRALWKRQLGTAEDDFAFGVATDGDGNVYLTGSTYGSLEGPLRGEADAWIAKYDAAGRALWKRQLGTAAYDAAPGVETDRKGNVYLTGSTDGSLGGPQQGAGDAWVAKHDAAGHVLWKRQLGTTVSDAANGVATDHKGNVYLTGETTGSLGGANRGSGDAWVAKYGATGHALRKRQLGTAVSDEARGVATDHKGNVYLTGETTGSLGGANRGFDDARLAKYDIAGHVLWKRQLGAADLDRAIGVATDTKSNVYVTGYTFGSLGGPNRGSRSGMRSC